MGAVVAGKRRRGGQPVRVMIAADIDPSLREAFRSAVVARGHTVKSVLNALIRAYVEGAAPEELVLRYRPEPDGRRRKRVRWSG